MIDAPTLANRPRIFRKHIVATAVTAGLSHHCREQRRRRRARQWLRII